MATFTGRDLGRGLLFNGNKYQGEECYGVLTYSTTTNSDNSIRLRLESLKVYHNSWQITGAEKGRYCTACCGNWSITVGSDFGGGTLQSWNLGVDLPLGNYSWTRGSSAVYTIQPGSTINIPLYAHNGPNPCGNASASFSYTNNLSKPTPRPPSLSPSCHANAANGNTLVFNGGGSWGWCDTGYNSSSYTIYDDAAMTRVLYSGSGTGGTFSGFSPNTRYYARFSKSNGCYSRSATCSAVTVTPNSLSDAAPKSWDSASVRLSVTNGGGEYDPNTTIWLKECNRGSWRQVATSTTKSVEVIELTGLVEETCYQVQARTTTPAGTYTGNTVQFNTPKKGLCIADFTKIEPGMNEKTYEAIADICYKWETTKVPATITVMYQVKDGYDKTWYESEPLVTNEYTGEYCLTLRNLYPNQTLYQTYIHTETDEATYDSPMQEFVTPVIPEPDIHNCENFEYLTELLCQSVKKLYHGNKTIYANPASQALCDPYNEDPTMLTIWSRALRLFHAMYCLVCDMGGARLTASKPGQYLVGEAGWQDIITIIDENAETENWKLATSNAIWQYMQDKLHTVWHYHEQVDVLVYGPTDLEKFPDATSAIIVSENAIYRKVDGEWVKSTDKNDEIDDMGVWHIRNESSTEGGGRTYYVQAGSAWYQWQGDWQPLDADVIAFAKIVDAMWEKRDQAIYNEQGADRLHVDVKDRNVFDCSDYPSDERWVTFITEPQQIAPPGYHLLTFETGPNATIVQAQEVLSGALGQKPTDPEKTCMDFVTWNDAATDTEFDWSLPVTKDYTLEAVWQPHPVAISFDIGDKATGDVPATINGYCGDKIGTLPTTGFERPGGTFVHWAIDGVPIDENYVLERDSTAVAVWEMEEFDVTFVLGNGEANVVKKVEYGDSAVAPADPSRDEYIFTGWFTDSAFTTAWDASEPITANTTVYAGWIPAAYTVTFNPNGGTDVPSQKVAYEAYATRPADPTRDGYIIKEWQLNGVVYNFDVPVTEDITLDAVWNKVWKVTFDANGGEPTPEVQVIKDGELANLPQAPTKDGCEFGGWYTGEEPDCPKTTYTVKFDISDLPAVYDGLVQAPADQEVDPDGKVAAPGEIELCLSNLTSTQPGQYAKILGWYELGSADEGQNWDFNMMSVNRNMTLKARVELIDPPAVCGKLPEPD